MGKRAAIYVAKELLDDKAEIHIYDPKVTEQQIIKDLEYVFKENNQSFSPSVLQSLVKVHANPYKALKDAHAIAVLTEWDETKLGGAN